MTRKHKTRAMTPARKFRISASNPVLMSEVKVVKEREGATSFGTGPCFTLVFQRRGKVVRERGPHGVRRKRGKPTSVIWHAMPTYIYYNPRQGPEGSKEVAKKLKEAGGLRKYETDEFHPKTVTDGILDYLYGRGRGSARISVTIIPGRMTLNSPLFSRSMDEIIKLLHMYKKEGKIHSLRTRGISKGKGSLITHVDQHGRIYRDSLKPWKRRGEGRA